MAMIQLEWPVNLNIFFYLFMSVLIMELSLEHVIKYSFYKVIILCILDE